MVDLFLHTHRARARCRDRSKRWENCPDRADNRSDSSIFYRCLLEKKMRYPTLHADRKGCVCSNDI